MSDGVDSPGADEELRALRKDNKRLERRVRQLDRMVKTSEHLARQTKAALLSTLDGLRDRTLDLERAKDAAESAMVAKDRFLATMSHEIRTPMNGVIGCIDLLGSTELEPGQRDLADTLKESAETLMALLNDVLDFAKLQGGHTVVESTAFDLPKVLGALVHVDAAAARARGVELCLEIGPDVPRHVLGDPHRLRQVLGNLTSNALKFTKSGAVTVRACVVEGTSAVRFSVQDTGIGMAPEVLDHIFDAFTQADESTTRRFGGTGLGLAISRTLVTAMGGELCVESQPGEGSTFCFEVLFGQVDGMDARAAKVEVASPETDVSGLRVLVVDDTPTNLLLACKMLERMGCEGVKASGGEMAVALASEGGWDVILMDCSMPDVDGFQATARIRALPGDLSGVYIVALTAYSMEGDRERCFESGMDDYLSKPMRLDQLRAGLARSVVGRGRRAA